MSSTSSWWYDEIGGKSSSSSWTHIPDEEDGRLARSGVGDGGGAAPREGMVGVVGGERLYAGRRRRTMACRRMEFIRRRLGRG